MHPPATPALAQRRELFAGVKQGVLIGMAIAALSLPPRQPAANAAVAAAPPSKPVATQIQPARFADFAGESASDDAQSLAHWIVDSGDNQALHFAIIDKKNTQVLVFNPNGRLTAATPVLLGAALGDDSVVGIGKRPIALVAPHERTTPAGRFMAQPGRNADGEDIVWVDYEAAVSMHRVRAKEPQERRLERLASPTSADNRISYGCINIPPGFYDSVIKPAFQANRGLVYVLPEVKTLAEVFPTAYDVQTKTASLQLPFSAVGASENRSAHATN
jgi:hypothetical protein